MGKCNFRVSVNLIVEKDNKICLMRRFNTDWCDGMYALMGGHVEDSENPIDAVVREAKEELGLIVESKDLQPILTMAVNPDHIYLYFRCKKYIGEPKNCEPDQCDDLRFFDKDSLPDNIIGADKLALNTNINNPEIRYMSYGY